MSRALLFLVVGLAAFGLTLLIGGQAVASIRQLQQNQAVQQQLKAAVRVPPTAAATLPGRVACPANAQFAGNLGGTLDDNWSVTGDRNRIHFADGWLRLTGTDANPATAPTLQSRRAFTHRLGLTFATLVRPTVTRSGTDIFLTSRPAAGGLATRFGWIGGQLPRPDSTAGDSGATRRGINYWGPYAARAGTGYAELTDNIDTLLLTVLRSDGYFFLVATNQSARAPEANLVYEARGDAGAPKAIGIAAGGSTVDVSAVCVVEDTQFDDQTIALALDTFHRPDSGTLGRPTKGGSPWQSLQGEWQIASHAAECAGPAIAAVDLASADTLTEARFTTPREGPLDVGVVFGVKDQANYWLWHASDTQVSVDRVVDGASTSISATSALLLQPGTSHRLLVRTRNGEISVWLDEQNGLFSTTPLVDNVFAGRGIGLYCGTPGVRFSSFTVWPATIPLPSTLASLLGTPLRAGGKEIFRDSLRGTTTLLQSRESSVPGTSWHVRSGLWHVTENGTTATESGVAVVETNRRDVAAEVTVRLPAADFQNSVPRDGSGQPPGDSFPGVVARAAANGNRLWARFLWQSGSPEIELVQVIANQATVINAVKLSGRFNLDEDYRLRIAAVDREVVASFDGAPVVQATLGSEAMRQIAGTSAGLETEVTGTSVFKDFVVADLSGQSIAP